MENQTTQNQIKESRVKKILDHEVSRVIAIIVVVFSFVMLVMLPINSIQKDIETINGNHLMHIQDNIEEIKDYMNKNEDEKKIMLMQIERTATIMEQHIINDKN